MGLIAKKIIYGCESRGDADSPYLTRYSLPRLGRFRAALHVFHRSDHDEMHDHPWPFVSVILWRGYVEETPCPLCAWDLQEGDEIEVDGITLRLVASCCGRCENTGRVRKRVWPGSVLIRRPEHAHRVELVDGKKAITLVVMGPRVREWGFFTRGGWERWTEYYRRLGC